jgi:NDP-sugar pyrophosphorylase family protein
MKAMIFAAGLGSRLKPFTLEHPKALVTVGGKPMLQRVIENVAAAGVREVVVNVHHFASQIVDFLRENDNFGLEITVSDESDCLLDTGGGLLKARDLLVGGAPEEPILLHNADILTDLPLGMMLERHKLSGADVTLLCGDRHSSRRLYFAKDDDRLAGWENVSSGEVNPKGFRPREDVSPSPFNGVHIVNPSVFTLLEEYAPEEIKPFSIVPFYLAMLSRIDIRRYMLPEGCRWFDVGSSEKLSAAERAFCGNQ